jgi:hypothetical protein
MPNDPEINGNEESNGYYGRCPKCKARIWIDPANPEDCPSCVEGREWEPDSLANFGLSEDDFR